MRADNLDTGEPLPRIAPVRRGATPVLGTGPRRAARPGPRDTTGPCAGWQLPTDGGTLASASVTYSTHVEPTHLTWFARLDNLIDRLAYSATSVLTQTVSGKVPLPGRGVKVGAQASFD